MLNTLFVTKVGMMQAWSSQGKRFAVTKCKLSNNAILGTQKAQDITILEVGSGSKKLKNVPKPLQKKIESAGFTEGVTQVSGVHVDMDSLDEEARKKLAVGKQITVDQVLEVGDVVQVQGTSKGHGFAGVMKRHGFHGGPATHGQSDRERAPGSIGAGTYPGRVWKGKKMPGHYGVDTKTVTGLVVLHADPETGEVWLSGPVPGFNSSIVKITKTGKKKTIKLDLKLMGLEKPAAEEPAEAETQNEEGTK